MILGNFDPQKLTRAFMDHLLDWRLIHHDERKWTSFDWPRSSASQAGQADSVRGRRH
jgi:hypothetical protein